MSNHHGLDDNLLKLSALNTLQEADYDDDDDEEYLEAMEDFLDDDEEDYDDDDDEEAYYSSGEYLDDDDDDDDESFSESGGLSEARRRSRRRRSYKRPSYRTYGRRRRIKKVRGSRSTTLRSKTGQRMRVRFGKNFATSVEVNKLVKDTERKFTDAMKERKANYDRLSKQIGKATRELDEKVALVRKSIKKIEKQSQTSSLIGMLQGPPKMKTIKFTDSVTGLPATPLNAEVEYEPQDMMLPLLLSGGLGSGSGSGDDTLLLALAFSKR